MILARLPRGHRSLLVKALLLVFGCAGFVACSSTTVTTSPSDAGASDAASADATTLDAAVLPGADSSLPDARSDAPSGDAAAGECGFHPKQTACTNCCVAAHSDGAGAYLFAVANCMCVDARCQKECAATFCADTPKDPDAACNACISAKTGECSTQIAAECSADADCVAFDRCMGESGCLGKPQ